MKNLPINQELKSRLLAFRVGSEATHLSFIKRLSKENGWSTAHAEGALEEYKRFLFLGTISDGIVTPSEAVDQVWHLHLLYTESYWNDLCGEILQRAFHHGPSRGSQAENRKFGDCYLATLKAYEQTFGTPPADLWPTGPQPKTHYQRVDLLALQRRFETKSFLAAAFSFVAGALVVAAFFLWH